MQSVAAWLSLPFLTLDFGGLALVAALFPVFGVKIVLYRTAHRHADRRIFVAKAELARIPCCGVDIHVLDPFPVEGLTYDARDTLAATVRDRMEAFLHENYGTPVTLSRLETSVHGA